MELILIPLICYIAGYILYAIIKTAINHSKAVHLQKENQQLLKEIRDLLQAMQQGQHHSSPQTSNQIDKQV
ncbi:hypothetical protein DUZ99_04335 [Xylanibacillus composti]|uniref:Uncharacterized protein n=1 Tax=Xylanibacillus composti TaxID=1572762 RepID=A0A8J4GZU4_9BACL|nr:hypothetical protein [Xylanibacillus composti]MDT9724216.1 hypothetical protein [Xylanibacillus composti]GIQ68267.1 hypothetical protein XYCOK13_10910 [Xylanibacillus composti]